MAKRRWHRPRDLAPQGRDATLVRIIEVVEHTAPETKSQLADELGISEQYLSELLQELKRDGVVKKAYVVDDAAAYARAASLSPLLAGDAGRTADEATPDDGTAPDDGIVDGEPSVVEPLRRLHDVTAAQYTAAHEAFRGHEPERPATALESLTNRRYATVLSELKSYTLTTDWPGNRVASDLATITTNLEIVGDRACFIADAVEGASVETGGVLAERVTDVFAAGETISDLTERILFEGEANAYADLLAAEEDIHRDLGELFELITTYEPEAYGYLASVTRALERAIYYWVHAAEIAVRLHTGCQPDHVLL